jgi:outer membrane receptor protein involved in Fe transport
MTGHFWTGSKSSSRLEPAINLNNTFVLNAGMQFNLSKKWTIWAKGENLLDQQYQRWANYPSLGVQFIAGVQYKFSK